MFTGRRVDFLDGGKLTLQINRHRYYDYYTGRWLTQDPLGIDPAGEQQNPFGIPGQYLEARNLYEYANSRPVSRYDPMGLETYCCKTRTTHYAGPGSGIMTGPGPRFRAGDVVRRTCTQSTITSECASCETACCAFAHRTSCRSLRWGGWETTVSGCHAGRCKWCDVYLKTTPLPVVSHWFVYVKCERTKWTAEISYLQGPRNRGRVIFSRRNRYRHATTMGHCKTSQEVAGYWEDSLSNQPWPFWTGGTCAGFAIFIHDEMCSMCP